MKEQGCNHCKENCEVFKIPFPSDLSKAIRVVKDNLSDGAIVESKLWPRQYVVKHTTKFFTEIPEKAPWADVLEYYFECPFCHQLFRLSVETYHGSGGAWEPLDEKSL